MREPTGREHVLQPVEYDGGAGPMVVQHRMPGWRFTFQTRAVCTTDTGWQEGDAPAAARARPCPDCGHAPHPDLCQRPVTCLCDGEPSTPHPIRGTCPEDMWCRCLCG